MAKLNSNTIISNSKRPKTKLEKVMYILAIIMAVFGSYMIYAAIAYIISYYSNYSMSISDGLVDVIQYVISNSAQYFVYALIFFSIARITVRLENIKALNPIAHSNGMAAVIDNVEETNTAEPVVDTASNTETK